MFVSDPLDRESKARGALIGTVVFFAVLCVSAFSYVGSTLPAQAKSCPFKLGYNLMHVRVDEQAQAECRPDNQGAMVQRDWNILVANSNQDTRQTFRSQLQQMAKVAPELRTLVWFRHKKTPDQKPSRVNKIGIIDLWNGKADESVYDNLSAFISDAAHSGMTRLIIAFAPIGNASPTCKIREWGDCYESAYLQNTWDFMKDIITRARDTPHGGMELVFDLGNEICLGVRVAEANKREFIETVLTRYRDTFGPNQFTISCHGNTANAMINGLQDLTEAFRRLDMTPALYDVHIYFDSEKEAEAALIGANRLAKQAGRPLIVGETYIGSTEVLKAAESLSSRPSSALTSVLFWPKPAKGQCNVMVNPLDRFGDAARACDMP